MFKTLKSLFRKPEASPVLQRLVLVRHADALPATFNGEDETRELSDKGKDQALALGDWLTEILGEKIGLALTSTATRTVQTYLAVQSKCALLPETWTREEELYHGGLSDYHSLIENCAATSLIVIGHNPAIGAMAASLIGGDAGLQARILNMPTAACYVFERQDHGFGLVDQRTDA